MESETAHDGYRQGVHHIALSAAKGRKKPLRVSARQAFCLGLGRQDINEVIDRQFDMTAAAA